MCALRGTVSNVSVCDTASSYSYCCSTAIVSIISSKSTGWLRDRCVGNGMGVCQFSLVIIVSTADMLLWEELEDVGWLRREEALSLRPSSDTLDTGHVTTDILQSPLVWSVFDFDLDVLRLFLFLVMMLLILTMVK